MFNHGKQKSETKERKLRMRLSKSHYVALALLFGLFAAFNLVVVTANQDFQRGALAAAGTVLGPMTGAISRDFQGCCLQASLRLLPYAFPLLLGGVLAQIRLRDKEMRTGSVRMVAWTVGWGCWFMSGIVSFGHALS